jgi:outer membrane biosynthesis protein TonB
MEVYAEFLRAQGRHDQASEVDARAAAIRQANAKPAPAHLADAYLVSEDVSVPSVAQRGEPQYSDEARAARLQGTVVVQVVIGTDGLAHDPRIVRGLDSAWTRMPSKP